MHEAIVVGSSQAGFSEGSAVPGADIYAALGAWTSSPTDPESAITMSTLPLTFGLSARALYEELHRDAALLEDEVTADRFSNFVGTAYTIVQRITNGPGVPATAKDKLAIDRVKQNRWIKICGDVANASKHVELTKRRPITGSATSNSGWGLGGYGKGGYGVGEKDIEVKLRGGDTLSCSELVAGVLNTWSDFFKQHGM